MRAARHAVSRWARCCCCCCSGVLLPLLRLPLLLRLLLLLPLRQDAEQLCPP